MLVEGGAGKYVVVFDPLDGSSNIDASIPTGMFVPLLKGFIIVGGTLRQY